MAYPHLAANPVHGIVRCLAALRAAPLDAGSAFFAASNLEITSIDVGNATVNVIPAEARATFNIRYNDHHTAESLAKLLRETVGAVLSDITNLDWDLETWGNGDAFITEPGPLTQKMSRAVEVETGRTPELLHVGAAHRMPALSRTTVR